MLNYIIPFLLFCLLFYTNIRYIKNQKWNKWKAYGLHFICCYHLAFAFIFTEFLQVNGGDALRYWTLTADNSQNAETWMEYWGHRTFFLQWLNYLPSKILGLSFFTGNFLYAVFSFIGIRILYKTTLNVLPNSSPTWLIIFFLWILLFPNLHFWTAGIGKEAILFTAVILALNGFNRKDKNIAVGTVAILLAWWVRPISGAILAFICFLSFIVDSETKPSLRKIALLLFLILGSLAVYRLTIMMHLEALTWQAFLDFSNQQMAFLQNLNAKSEIPMQDYNVFQRIYTLFFRPDWTDVTNFWIFASAVENSTFILLLLGASFAYLQHKTINFHKTIFWGILFGFGMMFIYAFTLNNLGIMMRMKSTYMIFFYIAASFVIFENFISKKTPLAK